MGSVREPESRTSSRAKIVKVASYLPDHEFLWLKRHFMLAGITALQARKPLRRPNKPSPTVPVRY